jgi:hypothetical protein
MEGAPDKGSGRDKPDHDSAATCFDVTAVALVDAAMSLLGKRLQ